MYEKLEKLVEKNSDFEVVVDFVGGNNPSYRYYAKIFNSNNHSNVAIAPGCTVENALTTLNSYVETYNL